ncbi:MAG: hypothetical protein ACI8UD_003790, partial [Planctomycetota bacterium]
MLLGCGTRVVVALAVVVRGRSMVAIAPVVRRR